MKHLNLRPQVVHVMLQPNKPKKGKKKVAAAPLAAKKVEPKKVVNPLFEKRPKNFGIGTLASCLADASMLSYHIAQWHSAFISLQCIKQQAKLNIILPVIARVTRSIFCHRRKTRQDNERSRTQALQCL